MKASKGMFDTFTPFNLTIRVETPKEQAGLYNILNHAFIIDATGLTNELSEVCSKLEHDQRFPFEDFDKELIRRYKNKGDI
jgi:hypothetical protein